MCRNQLIRCLNVLKLTPIIVDFMRMIMCIISQSYMVQQSSCSVVWKVFDVINEIDIIPSHERRLMFNKRCVKLNREGFNETYFIYATLFFHILVLWFLCFISKLYFNLSMQIFFNWQCWYRFQVMKIINCPAQFSRLTKLVSGYQ